MAAHYTWMFGRPYDELVDEQRQLLQTLGVSHPTGSCVAVDLGYGSGFQSIALAELGYGTVVAVDSSPTLLAELAGRVTKHVGIRPVCQDPRHAVQRLEPGCAEVAVCMGDMLTHLPEPPSVTTLLADIRTVLAPGGRVVLTFRDYITELTGTDRVIPLNADDSRIMVRLLEYESDFVVVHHLLHLKTADGAWRLSTSTDRKLRIDPGWVAEQLDRIGFVVDHCGPLAGGMQAVTGKA